MLVTDWAEISDLNTFHKVAATQEDAVRIVMQRTSVDMSMVPYDASFATYLIGLVERGTHRSPLPRPLHVWLPRWATG
jgi:beta-glucosidase